MVSPDTSLLNHGPLPTAPLCEDHALTAANLRALVHTPVIAPKEHTLTGWFGQTDFTLCQRHTDAQGDARDDSVFITVWKRWDFYVALQPASAYASWPARLFNTVVRKTPLADRFVLQYRPYTHGVAATWHALDDNAPALAHQACAQAWHGVLDYMRKALAQHRAHYPLEQALRAALTPERLEALSLLPLFTEQFNHWWDPERNGLWQGHLWVGARQPCMHEGEPWGRAIKFSWKNGAPAAGDAPDDAHSAYQLDVDEARAGPPVVMVSYTQRQSEPRTALPRCAADHLARLLRFFGWMEAHLQRQEDRPQKLLKQ